MSKVLAELLETKYEVKANQFENHDDLKHALAAGEIDLAILEQHKQPSSDIATISYLYPSVLHVLSKSCSPPNSMRDIVSLGTIYPGPKGSAGYRLLVDLAEQEVIPPLTDLKVLDSPFGVDPDVMIVFGGILSGDALSRLAGYCLVSLGDVSTFGKGGWVEGLAYRFPRVRPFLIPAGLYPGLSDTAVVTLAIPSHLVVNAHVDNELAFDIAQLLQQYKNEFSVAYPLAADSENNQRMAVNRNLPLHPGAQRFLNRDDPSILERYAESLALIVTLVIAVTSGLLAVLRQRRQARKDRLDDYFDRLLQARSEMQREQLSDRDIADNIIELQRKVTTLVVSERIAADSLLVAFYTLSNQILNEAGHVK